MEPIKAIHDLFWNKDDSFRNEAEMFRNIVCTSRSASLNGLDFEQANSSDPAYFDIENRRHESTRSECSTAKKEMEPVVIL